MKLTDTSTLTASDVQAVLSRNRSNRSVEYLCRAFLTFGADAMTADDLAKLTKIVNTRSKP